MLHNLAGNILALILAVEGYRTIAHPRKETEINH